MHRVTRWIAIALLAVATTAGADPAELRVEYAAPDGCPTRAQFEGAVRERVAASSATVTLAVVKREGAYEGQLTVESPGVESSRRVLADRSCEQVVDALALIAALAVNESADAPVAPPPAAPPPVPVAAPAIRVSPPPSHAATTGFGGDGGAYRGVSPHTAFGGELFAERTLHVGGILAPSIRLGIAATTAATTVDPGQARFVWAAGELGVCPIRIELGAGVAVAPCARFDLGALYARGTGVGQAERDTQLWLAPSALARIVWRIARHVGVELDVGAVVPLERNRYYFPPSTTVFEVPSITGAARLGIGFEL